MFVQTCLDQNFTQKGKGLLESFIWSPFFNTNWRITRTKNKYWSENSWSEASFVLTTPYIVTDPYVSMEVMTAQDWFIQRLATFIKIESNLLPWLSQKYDGNFGRKLYTYFRPNSEISGAEEPIELLERHHAPPECTLKWPFFFTAPAVPINLKTTAFTAREATFTWSPAGPDDKITTYTLYQVC
jgi:hypothetical protein